MGIGRLLTSGQAANALDGSEMISQLVRDYPGIEIMPGGGIYEQNLVGFGSSNFSTFRKFLISLVEYFIIGD